MNQKFDFSNLKQAPKELIEFIIEIQRDLSRVSDDNLDDEVINRLLEESGASDREKHIFMSFVIAEKLRRKYDI